MKKTNKILSIFLALLMVFSIIPMSSVTASAVNVPVFTMNPSQAAANVGDVISVDVSVSENSKLCGLIIELIYDSSAFEVVEVISEGIFSGEGLNPAYSSNTIRYVGAATTIVDDDATTIFTVKFKILENCGEMYLLLKEAVVVGSGDEQVNVTMDANFLTEPLVIHEAKDANVITAPTCEKTGFKTYNCPCGAFVEEITPATGHKYVNRICSVCNKVAPGDVITVTIQQPSRTTIRNKDGIVLHAKVEGSSTAGTTVKWTASNDNFKTEASADGKDLTIISNDNGYTTFTATVYNSRGKELSSHSIEMRSKAGFFDKIGGFFRSLFGSDVIYEY